MIRFGYPAQNLTIRATTNRTLRLAGLPDVEKPKGLVGENVSDLEAILRWNAERGVALFRIGQNSDSVAVLHMGDAYADKPASNARFVKTKRPEVGILRYLALENDERIWTVAEVVETARVLGIPALADAFHHGLNPGGLALGEALDLALPTWEPRRIPPKLHLSSQDQEKRPGAHAYCVTGEDWQALLRALDGRDADVMVEAKGKELALVASSSAFQGRVERRAESFGVGIG